MMHHMPTSANVCALPPIDDAVRFATAEVSGLLEQLEPTLDTRQRRLLSQLRLASESLGMIRATARLLQRGQPGDQPGGHLSAWRRL
jgi:hypothetical protein